MALKMGDNRSKHQSVKTVLRAYGANPPELILRLAERCDENSQNYIATQIGRSSAAISCILNNSYKGDLNAVLKDFKTWDEGKTINCPTLGEISHGICKKTQNQKPQAASTLSMRQWRACQKCQYREI